MTIVKSIGKNTLGGGKKMNVELRTYNRSTHDLSYVWRNTQAAGPLVPFMCEVGLPNDTWDIDLQHHVMTHPTIGPLFGSFKMQADVFVCPIRLYNAMLHNNALNVGLNMKQVKLPQIKTNILAQDLADGSEDFKQIDPSCLLSYLGIKGFGNEIGQAEKNGTALLGYYDIFKNFYANKQEEKFPIISGYKKLNAVIYLEDPLSPENKIVSEGTYAIVESEFNEINTGTSENPNVNIVLNAYIDGQYIKYKLKDITGENKWTWGNVSIGGTVRTCRTIKLETDNSGKFATLESSNSENGINIIEYDLEQIDNIREDILSFGRNQYIIGNTNNNTLLQSFTGRVYGKAGSLLGTAQIEDFPFRAAQRVSLFNTSTNQFGLAIKTYQSDIFNNWVNTEWIDGENGINAITAVKIDPESNSFQLDTLNLAKKVYDMLNRIAVSDGTYQSWIETVYTNQYIERSETPIYMGGMSAEIEFQQVISNSATADEPLGTLAGRGVATNKKGGRLTIKIDEPSYIIGIVSLTPRVDYCQGNRFDTELKTLDDLHKPALDAIGFQDRLAKSMDWRQDNGQNLTIGKQPAWIDYMTNYNRTFGNFALRDNEAFMCLNRFYEYNKDGSGDYTSYIDPTKYNYIFADTELSAMNFWIQIGVGIECRRAISAKVIPNI